MKLLEKLEAIKQLAHYAVNFTYGEGVGCDDSDVKPMERNVVLVMTPVGCLGSKRKMWRGKMKDFLKFDFKSEPKEISNPPKREEYEDGGYFIWGAK